MLKAFKSKNNKATTKINVYAKKKNTYKAPYYHIYLGKLEPFLTATADFEGWEDEGGWVKRTFLMRYPSK